MGYRTIGQAILDIPVYLHVHEREGGCQCSYSYFSRFCTPRHSSNYFTVVTMSDWDDVRKLATDFQRLQSTAGANRLSERNCIELVTRLIRMGQIEVVYTLDGKEYITPLQLEKEIINELQLHRGLC